MLNSKHFIGIHGYMLVYSVASQQSFDMINVIHDKILNHLVCTRMVGLRKKTNEVAGCGLRSDHDRG